jgi:hypothetical protein
MSEAQRKSRGRSGSRAQETSPGKQSHHILLLVCTRGFISTPVSYYY